MHREEKKDKSPKISIITVCFRAAEDLRFTIESLKKFRSENLEYIVIDGGSEDETLSVIKEQEDFIDFWVSEKDKGIYDAMQKGVRAARGTWVNFMNAGDCFETGFTPEKILAHDDGQSGVIYGDYRVRYKTFSEVRKAEPLGELWTSVRFCHQSAFYRRELLEKFPFSHGLITADFEQAWRMYLAGVNFSYLPETIASFAHTGVSSKTKIRIQTEIEQTILKSDRRFSSFWKFRLRFFRVWLTEKIRALLPERLFEKLQKNKNRNMVKNAPL